MEKDTLLYSDAAQHRFFTEAVPVSTQVEKIASVFGLDATYARAQIRTLPKRPTFGYAKDVRDRHLHWCAFPSVEVIGQRLFPTVSDAYVREMQCIALLLRYLKNHFPISVLCDGVMRTETRTKRAQKSLRREQKGDICIVAVQRGIRYLGRSAMDALETLPANEYGLTSLMGLTLMLTHAHLFGEDNPFCMDLPGTELFRRNSVISHKKELHVDVPFVRFQRARMVFTSTDSRNKDAKAGAATFFLPRQLDP